MFCVVLVAAGSCFVLFPFFVVVVCVFLFVVYRCSLSGVVCGLLFLFVFCC